MGKDGASIEDTEVMQPSRRRPAVLLNDHLIFTFVLGNVDDER